ncbi:unnamed protein product [Coregonus sp. 'balchen']|nr:unnamed protein product [Coregonus sp. 'balchen']
MQQKLTAMHQQVWHTVQMPQQQREPAADPKHPQQVWHPAQMLHKQPTSMPQQVWHPAQMPQKQPAAEAQKQLNSRLNRPLCPSKCGIQLKCPSSN